MADVFKAGPQGKVDAKKDLTNGGIYAEDFYTSAQNQTFLQRGSFTLTGGLVFINFPRPYISATTTLNPPTFIVTSQTANHVFVESFPKNSAFGSNNISTICGMTISGSGTDSGFWLVLGYK